MAYKVLKSKNLVENKWIRLREDTLLNPANKESNYYVLEEPDYVIIIPILKNGDVLLVKQYRHGANEYVLEFPAGGIEKSETPEVAAKRELEEETGFKAKSIKFITSSYTNPARQPIRAHVFAAEVELQENSKIKGADPEEDIEIIKVSQDDFRDLVKNGGIDHFVHRAAALAWFNSSLCNSTVSSRRIVIFGGAFDPPHVGHFRVLKELHKLGRNNMFPLDEIWVMPSGEREDKNYQFNLKERRELVKAFLNDVRDLLCEHGPRISLNETEMTASPPFSGTCDLLSYLRQEYSNSEFMFATGSDILPQIESWGGGEELLKNTFFIVIDRDFKLDSFEDATNGKLPKYYLNIKLDKPLATSSSNLRLLLKNPIENKEVIKQSLSESVYKLISEY